MSTLITHIAPDYQKEYLLDIVQSISEASDWKRLFAGKRVLVKPNLLAALPPDRAVTAHPTIVFAAIDTLIQIGAEVVIGDSSGETMAGAVQTEKAFEVSGIAAIAKAVGVPVVSFEQCKPVPLKLPDCRIIYLTGVLETVDAVFSIPKFKTHTGYFITGAVKNLYGLVPGHLKALLHAEYPDIYEFGKIVLQSIHDTVRPEYTLVDAIVSQHGNGPMNGQPIETKFLVGGQDCYAIDTYLSKLIGLDPAFVPTIASPVNYRLVAVDGKEVISPINGFELPCIVPQGIKDKEEFVKRVRQNFRYPSIDNATCVACDACSEICPEDVIEDYIVGTGCIRCYCCYEVCKYGAINLIPAKNLSEVTND